MAAAEGEGARGARLNPGLLAHRGLIQATGEFLCNGVVARRLDDVSTLVVTKSVAGFDARCVEALDGLLVQARSGALGPLKFLVFDFTHDGEEEALAAPGFGGLVSRAANLIMDAPIVSIACARAFMSGADLEFALACSMLVGERSSRFSFAADPLASLGIYGFLAQKIGFVRAERLMDGGEALGVDAMRDLLLLKEVIDTSEGLAGIESFLRKRARRHNSAYGIYRAQRIATPSIYERLTARDLDAVAPVGGAGAAQATWRS